MDHYNHRYQVLLLPLDERLLVVVGVPADRTSFVSDSFVPLKPLKAFETSFVQNMRTAKNSLIGKLQVLKANGAGFLFDLFTGDSVEEVTFNLTPLSLTARLRRFVDET